MFKSLITILFQDLLTDLRSDFSSRYAPTERKSEVSFADVLNNVSPQETHSVPAPRRGDDSIDSLIMQSARKYDLNPGLIRSVIETESNFQKDAVSHAGAQGLMQLMPGTAKHLGVSDPFDPAQNIDGGSRYLREMLDEFGDINLALAAYNAGPGNVKKYGGIPPFEETQNYVPRVLEGTKSVDIKA